MNTQTIIFVFVILLISGCFSNIFKPPEQSTNLPECMQYSDLHQQYDCVVNVSITQNDSSICKYSPIFTRKYNVGSAHFGGSYTIVTYGEDQCIDDFNDALEEQEYTNILLGDDPSACYYLYTEYNDDQLTVDCLRTFSERYCDIVGVDDPSLNFSKICNFPDYHSKNNPFGGDSYEYKSDCYLYFAVYLENETLCDMVNYSYLDTEGCREFIRLGKNGFNASDCMDMNSTRLCFANYWALNDSIAREKLLNQVTAGNVDFCERLLHEFHAYLEYADKNESEYEGEYWPRGWYGFEDCYMDMAMYSQNTSICKDVLRAKFYRRFGQENLPF